MSNLRRRRRSGNYPGARIVNPTTDTGWKSYDSAGRLFLPAGVNYHTNPGSRGTKWGTDSAGIAYTLNTNPGVPFPAGLDSCTKIVHTSGSYQGITNVDKMTVAAGEVVTFSIYIHVEDLPDADNPYMKFSTYLDDTAVRPDAIALSMSTAVTSGFIRFSASLLIAAGENQLSLFINVRNKTSTFYLTGALIEKSSILTPYGDGSHSGWSWASTANASVSNRAASALYYPSPWATLPATGTIAGLFVPLAANTSYTTQALCGLYSTTTPAAELLHVGGKHSMKVGASSTSAAAFSAGATLCSIGRWDAAGTYLHHNGTAAAAGAAPTVGGAIDRLYLGTNGLYYQRNLLFSDDCITAAEAVLLDTLMRAGGTGSDVYRFMRDRGYSGSYVFPMDGSSQGYGYV